MSKAIPHRWCPTAGTGTSKDIPQRFGCLRCLCEKGFSISFGRLIYIDRFGKIHYRAPDCILPNTKL